MASGYCIGQCLSNHDGIKVSYWVEMGERTDILETRIDEKFNVVFSLITVSLTL